MAALLSERGSDGRLGVNQAKVPSPFIAALIVEVRECTARYGI